MECPSCGNVLSQDKNKKIECEYCGASVLPIRLETQNKEFQHTAESNFSEDLSEVRRLFEKSRYSDAREILIKLMEKDKTNWETHAELAIAEFWLGIHDLNNIQNVEERISDAEYYSKNNQSIKELRKSIAFNIASAVTSKKLMGKEVANSIEALRTSKKLYNECPDTNKIIDSHCEIKFRNLVNNMLREAKRDGPSYDPANSDIRFLYDYFCLFSSDNHVREAQEILAFLNQELKRHPNSEWAKIVKNKLSERLTKKGSKPRGKLAYTFCLKNPKIIY